jgi:hypothetical protein
LLYIIISTITPLAVPFAQGQDAERHGSVVGCTTTKVKDYTVQYEEQRIIVEALGIAQLAPDNKSALAILALQERQLDGARIHKSIAINNPSNCCIADIIGLHAKATTVATTITPSKVGASTSTFPVSPSENINMKRKQPESRNEWKNL